MTCNVAKSELSDSWEFCGDQVIRIHQAPRNRLFSPIGVPECPVDIRRLIAERTTYGKDYDGKSWVEKDFWRGLVDRLLLDNPGLEKQWPEKGVCETPTVCSNVYTSMYIPAVRSSEILW